jgi:hypothetical protein
MMAISREESGSAYWHLMKTQDDSRVYLWLLNADFSNFCFSRTVIKRNYTAVRCNLNLAFGLEVRKFFS